MAQSILVLLSALTGPCTAALLRAQHPTMIPGGPMEVAHQELTQTVLDKRNELMDKEKESIKRMINAARGQVSDAFALGLRIRNATDSSSVAFGDVSGSDFARMRARQSSCSGEEVRRVEKVVTKDLANSLSGLGIQWPEMTEGGSFPECTRHAMTSSSGPKGQLMAECFIKRTGLSGPCSSCWEDFWVMTMGKNGIDKHNPMGCQEQCMSMMKECDAAFDDMIKSSQCLGKAALPCLSCMATPAMQLTSCVGSWSSGINPMTALNATIDGIIRGVDGITEFDNGLENKWRRFEVFKTLHIIRSLLQKQTNQSESKGE